MIRDCIHVPMEHADTTRPLKVAGMQYAMWNKSPMKNLKDKYINTRNTQNLGKRIKNPEARWLAHFVFSSRSEDPNMWWVSGIETKLF